jgi:hypothetical protein
VPEGLGVEELLGLEYLRGGGYSEGSDARALDRSIRLRDLAGVTRTHSPDQLESAHHTAPGFTRPGPFSLGYLAVPRSAMLA